MKRLFYILAALSFSVSTTALSQDSSNPQILYIPGMPAPPIVQETPNVNANNSEPAQLSGQGQGKISRITHAINTPPTAPSPQPVRAQSPVNKDNPSYKGVVPPKNNVAQNAAIFANAGLQLSWIGFLIEGNEHKIFIQTTQPTNYNVVTSENAREIYIELPNVGAKVANNRRNLDMSYFNSPFKSAQAQKKGKSLRIKIEFNEPYSYRVTQNGEFIYVSVTMAGGAG
ncbi:MAG: AMIN domain-containing protein [Bradymonadales bacterium]|jgi:hypothetical protein